MEKVGGFTVYQNGKRYRRDTPHYPSNEIDVETQMS